MNTCGGWESVRVSVRQRVGVRAFETWFSGLEGAVAGDTLVLRCPDPFVRSWIAGRYGEILREAAGGRAVEYRVTGEAVTRPAPAERRATSPPVAAAVRSAAPQAPPAKRVAQTSFESFVSDPGNALAFEAARAVARGESGRCNPLLITGPSGVGKTHLCEAIRNEVDCNILYRSSEEFTTEVTQAIRGDRMPAVRHKYRRAANLLILEDVQFLVGKKATQAELFHTLDHLLGRGRRVVLTADRVPHELAGLDERLASRLASGLVARIGPPAHETRRAILRAKAAAGGVRLPDECLARLAERAVDSAGDLVAGLNQVVARATLLKQQITTELVEEALSTVELPGRRRSIGEIIGLVARSYSLRPEDLRSRSRKRHITRPRQLAMYLCRRYTDASLKEIGRALSRDHTSVMYAVDAIERRTLEEPQLRYQLEAISAKLGPAA